MSDITTPAGGARTGLKSRQKARLRHVPVTRRLAAWIAACAQDERMSFNVVLIFASLNAVMWTIILTALKGAQDVHMDVAEAFAWGQKFLLGYGKHPPLTGWIAGLWFRIFPVADWATYALAMVIVALGLIICWQIAIRVVERRRALFSIVMLALYPVFTWKGFKFNPDLVQLFTLPLFVLAFMDAFAKRSLRSAIFLGLATALAILTKYWVLTMIGAAGIASLVHPDRAKFWLSPAPWVAIIVCIVALSPHLWWLQQRGFLPLVYGTQTYGSRPFSETFAADSLYVVHNLSLLLIPIAFAAIALSWKLQAWNAIRARGFFRELVNGIKRPWVAGANSGVTIPAARNIWMTQIVVGIVPPIAGMIFSVTMKSDWGQTLYFLVPLSLVAIPALRMPLMALIRLLLIWLIFTCVMLLLSPIIAAQTVRRDGEPGTSFSPRSEFAVQLTEAWRARYNRRWAVVAGTTEIGEPITFYSPDHPAPFTPEEVWSSGLTTWAEAMRLGFIGACDTTDSRISSCEVWMNAHAPVAEKLDLTSRRYFHGKAGPAVKWKIWIQAPQRDDEQPDK
jgi:4-amino-4-deoxy-L-arabinose transferase-like glycosyltransferase